MKLISANEWINDILLLCRIKQYRKIIHSRFIPVQMIMFIIAPQNNSNLINILRTDIQKVCSDLLNILFTQNISYF